MVGIVFTLTVGVLLFATVGAVARQGNERLPLLGFSVFGLGYLIFGFLSGSIKPSIALPPTAILDQLSWVILNGPVIVNETYNYQIRQHIHFVWIGHSLSALLVGLLGSVLARVFRVDYDGPNTSNQSGAKP